MEIDIINGQKFDLQVSYSQTVVSKLNMTFYLTRRPYENIDALCFFSIRWIDYLLMAKPVLHFKKIWNLHTILDQLDKSWPKNGYKKGPSKYNGPNIYSFQPIFLRGITENAGQYKKWI